MATVLVAGLIAVSMSNKPADAQEAPLAPDWEVSVTLYGWMLSLDGSASIQGNEVDLDVPFRTIIENLDGGVMSQVDLRYGRLGGFVNGVYGRVTADERLPFGVTGLEAAADVRITFLEFGVSYALDPLPLGASGKSSVSVAPYIGGRYTDVDLKLALEGRRRDADIGFTDPIVGIRTDWWFGPNIELALRGDIGGFGVGSEFSWQVIGAAGYTFGLLAEDNATAFLGYRVLGQDYTGSNGDNEEAWDVVTHGPVLGLRFKF
ncbi:MAG: hypothetical protein AAFP17_12565 [Pseudomonadota bacterium]